MKRAAKLSTSVTGSEMNTKKVPTMIVLFLSVSACGGANESAYKPVSASEICEFIDNGFLQGLDGKANTQELPYSLSEFEAEFGVSKTLTGDLYNMGLREGKKHRESTDEIVDEVREILRDGCLSQVADGGKVTPTKPEEKTFVAIIGEKNEYKSGVQKFEIKTWSVDGTRTTCQKFLDRVRGDAVHSACISEEKWTQGEFPWWARQSKL